MVTLRKSERVLITGGAGFVGSHLADALVRSGHSVVLYDMLEPQVHGGDRSARPPYLNPEYELIQGDIRDPDALAAVLPSIDVIFHLAAMVGVGQSMYQIRRFTDVNTMGTANLLQLLVDSPGKVRKLIVASSMSIYGEGSYSCPNCGMVAPKLRKPDQMAAHDWDLKCPHCMAALAPIATAEDKPLYPTSIYAINKRDQEEMCLAFGHAYGIPTVAMRFFNIYGSRQALSNPYTGVAAIFSGRMLAGEPPLMFEDGEQMRDFVHILDIVQALELAMNEPAADYEVFNVGSGQPISVREVARTLAVELGWKGDLQVTQKFRAGDIRHCFANITKIREKLGYDPLVRFEDGVSELVRWVKQQQAVKTIPDATAQLTAHGLVR